MRARFGVGAGGLLQPMVKVLHSSRRMYLADDLLLRAQIVAQKARRLTARVRARSACHSALVAEWHALLHEVEGLVVEAADRRGQADAVERSPSPAPTAP